MLDIASLNKTKKNVYVNKDKHEREFIFITKETYKIARSSSKFQLG